MNAPEASPKRVAHMPTTASRPDRMPAVPNRLATPCDPVQGLVISSSS
jgi:hypothetical protein